MLMAGTRLAFIAVAMAVSISVITFAQTPESAIESVPAEAEAAEVHTRPTGNDTSAQADPSSRLAIPAEIEVGSQSRFNDLRRELLDDRAKLVDWWLAALAVVLGFFAIVAVVGGYIAFTRFREIEADAKNSVTTAKQHETATEGIRRRVEILLSESEERVERIRNLTAEAAANDPTKANLTVKDIFENPKASLTDKVIADALDLQQQGRNKEAIEKWQVIANLAEGTDNDLAARALFSVGYLLQGEDLKRSISVYNEAILLKPDLYEAYNNRGNVKLSSGQHEAAIIDFGEALNLKPDFAVAYNNRGSANAALGRHEAAIADFDEAIRLKSDFAEAFNNRGNAKFESGRHEAAIADFNEAINLKSDYVRAYINRGIAKVKLNLNDEARKDFETALELARNAGDADLLAKAKQWLRDLDADGNP